MKKLLCTKDFLMRDTKNAAFKKGEVYEFFPPRPGIDDDENDYVCYEDAEGDKHYMDEQDFAGFFKEEELI